MIRCWQCGIEPDDAYEVVGMDSETPVRVLYVWPDGDHPHAVDPPTPTELAAAGSAALARVLETWT